ncbi:hypothetical protein M670_04271 [Schinkia azotoformans MEV2011]|uniref:Lipoprotein n=1 Tax=Schinkia azotoformans MEV2011 TaxID=1348973 RepID=A0A072NI74_SCHAZ|nr:hypothetical protein [Schinkia azotoformans]KEF36578.1 hypothetical protein M670_04271 [Schinkia azotoformans MEV2011]MEC1696946.1 hypothetical protein [Schinkia azotoformans]MEC1718241.1 hypothetical protein [Schinkia azotoformans]MEC1725901.1 hypothetical protein [Schinkia azotoformans]MEC1740292.1 hypothetical protein [Schinkia azotoformans]
MKKSLIFVTSSLLSIGLLAGCGANDNNNGDNDNGGTTGVNYNKRGVNTENVRYNFNDRLAPDDVRYDYRNNNNGFGTFNNNYRNGDPDLVDVDYDNAEPDPGEEPNEDRNALIKGRNDDNDGVFNNNRGVNGNGNGVGGNMRTR